MKLSIVLCTYNGTKFLPEQLDSLRSQTVVPDEVIICDDRSTDGTVQMVEEYIHTHDLQGWQVHLNAQNKGYKRNFHDAVARAQGEWIAFCDQDDIWHADKLEQMLAVADSHPDATAIAGSFDLIDGSGQPIPHENPPGQCNHGMIHRPLPENDLYEFVQNDKNTAMLLCGNIALGCTLMVRCNLADIYVRSSEMKIPHDWECVLWSYYMGGLYFLNRPVIHYRLHGHNTIGLPIPSGHAEPAPQQKSMPAPSLDGRIDVMNHYFNSLRCAQGVVQVLGRKAIPPSYERYGIVRMRMLEKRSLTDWLLMQRYRVIYQNMFTLRQRIGDLLVLLRR